HTATSDIYTLALHDALPICDAFQDQLADQRVAIGDVAVIRAEGIEVLLGTRRTGVFSPTIFTHHGITLGDKQAIGLKNLFRHRRSEEHTSELQSRENLVCGL